MKLTKRRDYSGSIRMVWSDDKKICFGIVGTIGDLLDAEILEYANYSRETWMFIPNPDVNLNIRVGTTKEAALASLK